MNRPKITPEIVDHLESFFEFSPPGEFRDNLIEIYHMYILHGHESLPHDFHHLAGSMVVFLDFLKFAEQEFRSSKVQISGPRKKA